MAGEGDGAPCGSYGCPECGREFSSFAGLQLHRRRAHQAIFFKEKVSKLNQSNKKRWTEEETAIMAEFEVGHPDLAIKDLVLQMKEVLFPERTVDSLLSRRKQKVYKEAIKRCSVKQSINQLTFQRVDIEGVQAPETIRDIQGKVQDKGVNICEISEIRGEGALMRGVGEQRSWISGHRMPMEETEEMGEPVTVAPGLAVRQLETLRVRRIKEDLLKRALR